MCACVVLLGCTQNHPTDEVSPGIYELHVEADSDACSPSRAVGTMGPVGVLVRDGAIDAPVPGLSGTELEAPRVILEGNEFHAETNRRVPGCEAAWVHEEWTLLDSSPERFELLHSQEWMGLAACDAASSALPDAPMADCRSERRLQYELTEVCAAPCRLFLEASGVVCTCE